MNIHAFRWAGIALNLFVMTGCAGYVSPYAGYPAPAVVPYGVPSPVVPYGRYNYGVYPVGPIFRFGGGWGWGGYGGQGGWGRYGGWGGGHYRHH